jgi:hypothetical protein
MAIEDTNILQSQGPPKLAQYGIFGVKLNHLATLHHCGIRGRCYGHSFLRFLLFFSKQMAFFSKTLAVV